MNKMLQWATGSGKTKAALDMARDVIRSPSYSILIVVAERQHIQNWRDEMKKWGFNLKTEIICYASLKKKQNTHWDVLIFDECHHIGSELRQRIIRKINADNVFALSATPGESLDILTRRYGKFDVSRKSLNKLIKSGRLPKPEVFVYDLRLSNKGMMDELSRYTALDNRVKSLFRQFARTNFDGDKLKMLRAGLDRKHLLGELKTPYVKYLLGKIFDKRYICFCPSIDVANELWSMDTVHGAVITSKENNKDNKDNLDRFNNGEINHIYVVGMLTEGTNLKNIEAGVLIQLDKTERTMIQKFGRTLRSEHPKMYFFRFLDTVDDELVKNIAWNIDSEYLTNVEFPRKLLERCGLCMK